MMHTCALQFKNVRYASWRDISPAAMIRKLCVWWASSPTFELRMRSGFNEQAHWAASKRLHNYDARCCIIIMERYRSGHNGADSKSVCAQAHEGSNPSLSANAKHTKRCAFCIGGERGSIRTFFTLRSKVKWGFAFEPTSVWELAHKRLGEKSSRKRVPRSLKKSRTNPSLHYAK